MFVGEISEKSRIPIYSCCTRVPSLEDGALFASLKRAYYINISFQHFRGFLVKEYAINFSCGQ